MAPSFETGSKTPPDAQAPPRTYQVRVANTGEVFGCRDSESVLHAMEQLCRRGIPVGCRNGGCGVCKVRILSGDFVLRKMSRAVCTAEEEAEGQVLACRIFPRGDLDLKVVGKMACAVEARKA
ncbi:hypothetical protein LMG28688_02730 [Paraburkholderia caffeinitolerans]|uniref:2Fe-2S ferredoxin-type domain-containing protein n=1 Tax=Paraburkholderia caffeinitolerans TaxID=1723730 RepID=A0A6J5G0D8_9BURK|nr:MULTISPECIES: 2Fe-2S iron-sulfur cluster-binding protein [Paraburkholderia]CAB3788649.1 hypothetical protein LMG28688_02730 [Paraburkholderia caffeinitolerans]